MEVVHGVSFVIVLAVLNAAQHAGEAAVRVRWLVDGCRLARVITTVDRSITSVNVTLSAAQSHPQPISQVTVFDLISEHALISGHPLFSWDVKRKKKLHCTALFAITRPVVTLIGCNAVLYRVLHCVLVISNVSTKYCLAQSTQFNLLMWHFCYTVHVFIYIYIEQLCFIQPFH